MSKYEIVSCESRDEWDGFVANREEANFLQSWDFYEFHAARGKKIVRRIAKKGDIIVGAYAGVVETAKRGTYMAIAGGPIMDWGDKALVKAVFDDIREQGKAT
ncbi:peptidoglycan bridge formation glycyltransferase FemA/FemB family protein, partial [Candidatus Saccharibacteria bacterium]|nr:peptidoglycan bridge formation glycyltransferase FemA/FemB family protein [Candidatus Saccharibacteria bacterium]